MKNASLKKCLGLMLYEALSLIAIWLLCTFVFILMSGAVDTAGKRMLLQVVLWVVTGAYFVTCWVKLGQTLAMQAWRIRLVDAEDDLLSFRYALLRYALATISLSAFGLGFLWALVDEEQLFLHDRLLKTRLVQLAKVSAAQ